MPYANGAVAVGEQWAGQAGHLEAAVDVPVSNCCIRWVDLFRPPSHTIAPLGRDAVTDIRMVVYRQHS